jgi:hypothetical protein
MPWRPLVFIYTSNLMRSQETRKFLNPRCNIVRAQLDTRISTSTSAVIKTRKISPASCTDRSLKIMHKLKFQNCYDFWQRELDTYTNRNLKLSTVKNETTALLRIKILWNVVSSGLTSLPTFRRMAVLSSTVTNGHSS